MKYMQLMKVLNCISENVGTKLIESTDSDLGKALRTPGQAMRRLVQFTPLGAYMGEAYVYVYVYMECKRF